MTNALTPEMLIAVTAEKWPVGTLVRKRRGSWWAGRVVGYYSTEDNPQGLCVQLDMPHGPVQIYPAYAMEKVEDDEGSDNATSETTAP